MSSGWSITKRRNPFYFKKLFLSFFLFLEMVISIVTFSAIANSNHNPRKKKAGSSGAWYTFTRDWHRSSKKLFFKYIYNNYYYILNKERQQQREGETGISHYTLLGPPEIGTCTTPKRATQRRILTSYRHHWSILLKIQIIPPKIQFLRRRKAKYQIRNLYLNVAIYR